MEIRACLDLTEKLVKKQRKGSAQIEMNKNLPESTLIIDNLLWAKDGDNGVFCIRSRYSFHAKRIGL